MHLTTSYSILNLKGLLTTKILKTYCYRDLLQDFDNADTISIDTLALEEALLEERTNEISELNNLSLKVTYLHTSLLYYLNAKTKTGTVCYEAWKTLVKKVGGSPNTWKDLGYALEISHDDLNVSQIK